MGTLLPSHIKEVTLNGETGSRKIAAGFIHALNDKDILTEKAGFLFKTTVCNNRLMLGVTPYFLNGERTYHYDVSLPVENEFTLIGDINAEGVFTILFRPESCDIPAEKKEIYSDSYVLFARFLLENGYAGKGLLDEVTTNALEETGLFESVPETLIELSDQPCSADD